MKLVATKTDGDTYSAEEFTEGVSQEAQNAVLDSGQALNEADLQQLGKAISIYAAGGAFYVDSGAANAYVLSTVGDKLAPPALFNGMKITFVAGNTNTGASTVNVDGLGVTSIEDSGSALVAGRLVSGNIYEAIYISASSQFELIDSYWNKSSFADNFLAVDDGSESTPAFSFNNDPDTGMFMRSIGEVNLTTGGTLRLSVNSGGNVYFNGTVGFPNTSSSPGAAILQGSNGNIYRANSNTSTSFNHFEFGNPSGATVGSIRTLNSATSYNTSSDPRLKTEFEKIDAAEVFGMIEDAVEKKIIGQFEFKAHPGEKVMGYNAHKLIDNQPGFGGSEGNGPRDAELETVLKEAVYEHRKDKEGNPLFEKKVLKSGKSIDDKTKPLMMMISNEELVSAAGVDQSKRVPLLESAIYELIQINRDLENRIKKLEGK